MHRSKQTALPEAELFQRHSLDLRQLLLSQLVLEAVAGEEVEANPKGHTTRSTLPLQRVGPGNPRVLQALHAFRSIVPEEKKTKKQLLLEHSIHQMGI